MQAEFYYDRRTGQEITPLEYYKLILRTGLQRANERVEIIVTPEQEETPSASVQ